MEMDAAADRVVFERVSPSLLDWLCVLQVSPGMYVCMYYVCTVWLCVLQNSLDKMPTSRFSHSKSTAMRVVLREFLFSTNPLHFSSPTPANPNPTPPGPDPSLAYETLTCCDNSANHAVDANRIVQVSFGDFKMEKKGRSAEPESAFKMSMGQIVFRTTQPQSELHHQYNVTLHRRRSYRGQYTESKSLWTAHRFTVRFVLGATELRFDTASVDSFGVDLVNVTKNLVDFRALSDNQRDKVRSDRPNSPHTPLRDADAARPAPGGPDHEETAGEQRQRQMPEEEEQEEVEEEGEEEAALFQSYADCNRVANDALLLPSKVFEGKAETSRLVTAGRSSIEWTHADPPQGQQQCRAMDVRLGDVEVWVSVAAAIKALSAASNLRLFLRRVLGTMSFAKNYGLVFDKYIVPQSRDPSLGRAGGPAAAPVAPSYLLTSLECSRMVLYFLINPGSGKSVPLKFDWALLVSNNKSSSAETDLLEQQPEKDHSKSLVHRPKALVSLFLSLYLSMTSLNRLDEASRSIHSQVFAPSSHATASPPPSPPDERDSAKKSAGKDIFKRSSSKFNFRNSFKRQVCADLTDY